MKRLLVLYLFLKMLIVPVFSQENVLVNKQLAFNGEAYLLLKNISPHKIQHIGRHISVDKYDANLQTAKVYVNREDFDWLSRQGISYKYLTHPGMLARPLMAYNVESMKNWDAYPTYPVYLQMMSDFAAKYPDLCKVDTIGKSVNGRWLLALKISDFVATDEPETEFFYTSSMHGDETTGYVLMLRLADFLLSQYGTDARATEIINNMEVWINPLANPDGTYRTHDTTLYGATRGNANGIDINRNFKDPDDGDHPDGKTWQAETQVMMDFMLKRNFTLSANFHGGAEVLNYPWDTWYERHADDDWFQIICHQYADTSQTQDNLNFLGFDDGITNGYDWYPVSGGRQDFSTYFAYSREVTIEISNTKLLPAEQLPMFWNWNYRSFLNFMLVATKGAGGIVTDAVSGLPLNETMVRIHNRDTLNSWVYSDVNGHYMRPLLPGNYRMAFYKPGYLAKILDVSFSDWQYKQYDVALYTGNNAPFATDTSGAIADTLLASCLENTPARFCFSAFDFENDIIYIKQVTSSNGNASLAKSTDFCFQYTPANNFSGVDTIRFEACDLPGNCRNMAMLVKVEKSDDTGKLHQDVKIFPNPASDFVFGVLPQGENVLKIQITNSLGSEIEVASRLEGNNMYISVNQLPNGLYFGKIFTQKQNLHFKFIVKR